MLQTTRCSNRLYIIPSHNVNPRQDHNHQFPICRSLTHRYLEQSNFKFLKMESVSLSEE
jgi:hypothetical protein